MHTMTPIPEGIRQRDAFVLTLMQALHLFGTPSHRFEQAMSDIARDLDMQLQVLATPTSVTAAIGSLENQRNFLLRVEPSEANLEKLADVQVVMQKVSAGTLNYKDAKTQIDDIVVRPERFGPVSITLAFALTSACVAALFNGNLSDVLLSFALGSMVGVMAVFARLRPRFGMIMPAIAAALCAAFSQAAVSIWPSIHPVTVTLGALIVLIPGLSLTVGVNELAHRHLVSGTSRLMGSLVTIMQLALGSAAGWGFVQRFQDVPVLTPLVSVSVLWQAVAVFFAAVGFTVLFRARWQDFWALLLGGALAYSTARIGTALFSPEFGAALGAWSMGCLSNILARLRDKPALTTILPGILLLVPGSLGFRSMQALLSDNVMAGAETALTTFMVAMSLVIGLFISNLTISPRKIL